MHEPSVRDAQMVVICGEACGASIPDRHISLGSIPDRRVVQPGFLNSQLSNRLDSFWVNKMLNLTKGGNEETHAEPMKK